MKFILVNTLSLLISCIIFASLIQNSYAYEWLSDEYFLDIAQEEIEPYDEIGISEKIKRDTGSDNPEIQYRLARMYDEGIGIDEDKFKAEVFYLKAAKAGLLKAKIALASFYNYKGDVTKSRKWFNDAAKNDGDLTSLLQLGLFYENGRGVFANLDKALSYYKVASNKGHFKSSIKLALYYHHREEPDLRKAIAYYKKAASQAKNSDEDRRRISILLARLYADIAKNQGNEEHIFKWYKKAAELGDINSQVKLASAYLNGIGVFADYEKAIEWYKKAANQGETTSMTMLGYIYSNGISVDINFEEAIRWYTYAAERGNDEAAWSLGNMYLTGNGVTQNDSEANKWFKRAESLRKKKASDILKKQSKK